MAATSPRPPHWPARGGRPPQAAAGAIVGRSAASSPGLVLLRASTRPPLATGRAATSIPAAVA
eukprot:7440101-Alexandrium_andersonii.AAC.1